MLEPGRGKGSGDFLELNTVAWFGTETAFQEHSFLHFPSGIEGKCATEQSAQNDSQKTENRLEWPLMKMGGVGKLCGVDPLAERELVA